MELAIEETSGTDAARQLGLPRQMVNYHVSALERAGFLIPVSEVRRRNMIERRLMSSARTYLISPDILGPLSASARRTADWSAPEALLSLTGKVQRDLAPAIRGSPDGSLPPSVLSSFSKLHFRTEDSRRGFVRAFGDMASRIVREFVARGAEPGSTIPAYGLVLGFYPLPRSSVQPREGEPQ